MTRNVRTYDHFCLVARALESVGDRWSLLVVRDLLTGDKRFTDLMDRLGGITPKTLSLRLRELEDAGIVAVDREPGRREVWYRLTPAGADLGPVIDGLSWWGLRHAWRRPQPGEPLHAEHLLRSALRAIEHAADDDNADDDNATTRARPAGTSGSTVTTTWQKATAAGGRSARTPPPGQADVTITATARRWPPSSSPGRTRASTSPAKTGRPGGSAGSSRPWPPSSDLP